MSFDPPVLVLKRGIYPRFGTGAKKGNLPPFWYQKGEFRPGNCIKVTLVGSYTFYVQYIIVRNHFYHYLFAILSPCIVFLEPLFFGKMGLIWGMTQFSAINMRIKQRSLSQC